MAQAVNLAEKLSLFSEYWTPKVVADFNGHDVMVVKVKGEFNWHSHPDTDDFFLVLKGALTIRLRDDKGAAAWTERLAPIVDAINRRPDIHVVRQFGSRTGPL